MSDFDKRKMALCHLLLLYDQAMRQQRIKKEHKQKSLYGSLFLLSLMVLGVAIWDLARDTQSDVQFVLGTGIESSETQYLSDSTEPLSRPKETIQEKIPVYLVGAVKNPGIYHIVPGTYLYELVELAGGLTEDAATEQINLAAAITTNQLIRLPTSSEIEAGYSVIGEIRASQTTLVDINQADQALLETLPGIGPATARAILAYREENGPFSCIEDLMKVPGIKEARFSALKDLIVVRGSH